MDKTNTMNMKNTNPAEKYNEELFSTQSNSIKSIDNTWNLLFTHDAFCWLIGKEKYEIKDGSGWLNECIKTSEIKLSIKVYNKYFWTTQFVLWVYFNVLPTKSDFSTMIKFSKAYTEQTTKVQIALYGTRTCFLYIFFLVPINHRSRDYTPLYLWSAKDKWI